VETLEFIFFSDQAAAVNALRGGQVDLVMRMPTPIFQSLEGVSGITPISVPTNGFDLIRLRSDREPGSDPRVVQALKLAVDRDAIVELVTQGTAVVGKDTPIGPLYDAYYAEDLEVPARDVERARELLAEAGYPDGLSLDLHVPDTGDRPDLAAVLQQQLAEAGFNINIIIEPESVYYGDDGWLEVDFGITGWGSRPLPQFYLDTMLVCDAVWNESHFCDEGFDMLAGIAGSTLDESERIEAYREIQEILIERGPVIIPYFFSQFAAIRDGFEGFELKAFPGRSNLAAITAP
jgi:peptide/nickel transport system substrate-binding protein